MDEFISIAELFRPLTFGAPEALDLMDDAAVIPARPGFDLIVTKDAMVEGVHFLQDDPPDLVARKLLRVNLSDLAAKGAEPEGRMVKRSGARAGDVVLVSGTIGDGHLGLAAARGALGGLSKRAASILSDRYRLPQPRMALQAVLRRYATAAADVSDGLLADAGHIGAASDLGVEIDLDRLPLSPEAATWRSQRLDAEDALVKLATGGDDYEIVCTVDPEVTEAAILMAECAGVVLTPIGRMTPGSGVKGLFGGRALAIAQLGWTHP